MAKKTVCQVTSTTTGDGVNATWSPAPLTNATLGTGSIHQVTLVAATPKTLTPPDNNALGVIIVPDAGVLAFLKGVAGDTGVQLADSFPTVLSFVAGTPIVLQSAAGGVVHIQWI